MEAHRMPAPSMEPAGPNAADALPRTGGSASTGARTGAGWHLSGLAQALTTKRLAVAVLFIGLFGTALGMRVDSDTFWHLRAGTWMLDHGRVLTFDVFSHTVTGRAWTDHSWLSEILMAGVYRAWGYGGLNVVTALVVLLTLFVVFRSDRSNVLVRAVVVALAAATTALYWTARPQIVSLLMTALFSHVLLGAGRRGDRTLWVLPPLMVAWVNLHAGFVVGFMLLGLTLVGECIEWGAARVPALGGDAVGGPSARRLRWLAYTTAACLVAVAVNPHGFAILRVPFQTVSMGVLQDYIQEWRSPDFHMRGAQFFIVMWIVAFGVIGASRRRLNVTDFLRFGVFGAAALLAARNIPIFAIVVAPIIMRHGGELVAEVARRLPDVARPRARALVPINWVLLLLVIAGTWMSVAPVLSPGATERDLARWMPVGAAFYLRTHPHEGQMFNAYNYGGFLSWVLYPERRVFVDGRTDLYDDAFLNEYIRAYMAGTGFERTLEQHDVRVVLVDPGAPIARALLKTPGWSLGYRDRMAVVLVKGTG